MHAAVKAVLDLFASRGGRAYGTEAVTQLEHALQCAMLADEAAADDALVVSALLHDVGHMLLHEVAPAGPGEGLDDDHEARGHDWVLHYFGAEAAGPVGLHVLAKRYLCSVDDGYAATLSPTSYQSFMDQGGCMDVDEQAEFEAHPAARRAILLRRWDDLAKVPGQFTPPLASYLARLQTVAERAAGGGTRRSATATLR